MHEGFSAKRPLIGIVPSHSDGKLKLNQVYLDAVWQAGGLGVVLSYTTDQEKLAEYAEIFDGFLFSGGVDVNPIYYGEEKRFDSVEIDLARDSFENALFQVVYETKKPILGICRGLQSINVWLGGTLHQHIEGHKQSEPGVVRTHDVNVVEGTLFHSLCQKDTVKVNTFHHQAIKTLADSLTADAVSFDGYVEVIHQEGHPFLLAVQFHPEYYHKSEDDDHSSLLFKAFVEACQ